MPLSLLENCCKCLYALHFEFKHLKIDEKYFYSFVEQYIFQMYSLDSLLANNRLLIIPFYLTDSPTRVPD